MRPQRTIAAIFCLAAAVLLWLMTGPASHDKDMFGVWLLIFFGGAAAIGVWLWLAPPRKPPGRGKP